MKWLSAVVTMMCVGAVPAQASGRSAVVTRGDGVYAVRPNFTEKLLVAHRRVPFSSAIEGWLSPGGWFLVLSEYRGDGVSPRAWLFDRKRAAWRQVSSSGVFSVEWSPNAARMALWTGYEGGELVVSQPVHGRVVYRARYAKSVYVEWDDSRTFVFCQDGDRRLVRVDSLGTSRPIFEWVRPILAFARDPGEPRFVILDETGLYVRGPGVSKRLPIEVNGEHGMKSIELTRQGHDVVVYTYDYGGEPMSWVEEVWWSVNPQTGKVREIRRETGALLRPDEADP